MSDDRRKPLWPWIVALLIGLPVLYVTSFGQALWMEMRGTPSGLPQGPLRQSANGDGDVSPRSGEPTIDRQPRANADRPQPRSERFPDGVKTEDANEIGRVSERADGRQSQERSSSGEATAFASFVERGELTEEEARQILEILREHTKAPVKGFLGSPGASISVITGARDMNGGVYFEFKKRDGNWLYLGSGYIIE